MPLETGAKLKRSKYHRICGETIYVYLLGWVAIRTYYYVTTISTLVQESSGNDATIVRPSYDLRMDRINTRSWLTGPSRVSKWDFLRSSWVVYQQPFDSLVASDISRIYQQKWTYREVGLWRYGCRTASRFRTKVLCQPNHTERFDRKKAVRQPQN